MGVIDKLRHDEASFDSASTSAMLCYYTGGNNRITSKAVTDNCIGEEARTYSAANDTPSDVEKQHHKQHHKQGQLLRLAMSLIEGTQVAATDRQANIKRLHERVCTAAGQVPIPSDAAVVRQRLKALARSADRNLAEQLQLLNLVEQEKLYEQDGCRNMLIWMDIHLGLARAAAAERLRVGKCLSDLPVLAALFALGKISFSQLRIITRYASPETDSEFALAALELSVSETKDYCQRFRHHSDLDHDAALAAAAGQEAAEAHAALRAYERRCLSIKDIDAHSSRITLDLPKELAAEFMSSLAQVEDWIFEGGEDDGGAGIGVGSDDENHVANAEPTYRQRRADAAVLMSRRSLAHAGEAVAMADRYRVHASVDVRHLASGPIHSEANEPIERPQLNGHGPISRATAQRIAAAAGFNLLALDDDRQVIAYAKKAAPYSKRERQVLQGRDRCCVMPGCGATRHLVGHHIVHRENNGQSTIDNGATVCASCHRLLHEGGFRLELIGPNGAELVPFVPLVYSSKSFASPALIAMGDDAVRKQVKAKLARLRRFRLYDANGCEYGSIAEARAEAGLSTRVDKSSGQMNTIDQHSKSTQQINTADQHDKARRQTIVHMSDRITV